MILLIFLGGLNVLFLVILVIGGRNDIEEAVLIGRILLTICLVVLTAFSICAIHNHYAATIYNKINESSYTWEDFMFNRKEIIKQIKKEE